MEARLAQEHTKRRPRVLRKLQKVSFGQLCACAAARGLPARCCTPITWSPLLLLPLDSPFMPLVQLTSQVDEMLLNGLSPAVAAHSTGLCLAFGPSPQRAKELYFITFTPHAPPPAARQQPAAGASRGRCCHRPFGSAGLTTESSLLPYCA